MALSWLIFLSKCRSELKRCKPDLEPGHCMVELVMPSSRASRLKEAGYAFYSGITSKGTYNTVNVVCSFDIFFQW